MDINSFTQAPDTVQLSYSFFNIDINASSCKYISGLAPLDANDTPIISLNNVSGVQTNPGPGSFIGLHITNYLPPNPNNAFYPAAKNSYRCSDLYIYNYNSTNKTQIVHNVKQVAAPLGEVVIKHNPNVSTDPTVYICFFLVASTETTSQPNDIDNIIEFVTTTQASASVISTGLSNCIPVQKLGAQFTDPEGNIVIILSEPIKINSKSVGTLALFDAAINSPLETNKLPSWLVENPANAFKLGTSNIIIGGADNIYMECVPTGVSKEEIKAYNVPINSQYTTDASKIGFMANTMRLTFILFGVFMLYALFPSFWGVITESVVKELGTSSNDYTDDTRRRLDSIEFWYYMFLISIALITLIFYAAFNLDQIHFTVSFIAIFMLVLTSFIILMSRRKVDGEHITFDKISIWPMNANSFNESDVGQVFMNLFPNGWGDLFENKWTIFFVVFLTISIDLIAISAIHKGLPKSVSETPSTDPKVMNVQELLDVIFGDIFALIAVRVMYIIYGPAAGAP